MSASPTMIGATTGGMPTVGQHSDDAAEQAGRPALLEYLRTVVTVVAVDLLREPAPPWHYCPTATPGEPSRIRVSVCGVRCDRHDPAGTAMGASAPHLVTCPTCIDEMRDADRGANDHLRAAPSELAEVRRAG